MTIIDRYLLVLFFKIFSICFVSLAGLYTVIHIFTNLDELTTVADQSGGLSELLFHFYGPRLLELFDKMAGVLILISAIFSITWMQRHRELTAIEASGITKARVVRPIIIASALIIVVSVVNREAWIPQIRHQLVRSLQNWTEQGAVPMSFQRDPKTGMLVQGEQFQVDSRTIIHPEIQLPVQLSRHYPRVNAEHGKLVEERPRRPAGILMLNVTSPERPADFPSTELGEETVVFTPRDYKWLKPNQMFVACELNVNELAYGKQMVNYWSLPEMIQSLHKPSRRFGFGDQVAVHGRILQPVLDIALLLLGLPLVVARSHQNIFAAAAMCMLVVIGVQMTTLVSHKLGAFSLLRPAALAAWLPVIIFVPLVAYTLGKLKT